MHNKLKRQNLTLFSILLLVLFVYPFISLADKPVIINGIPLLYLYILLVWLTAIIILYRLTAGKKKKPDE